MVSTILVPTDGSKAAHKAIMFAVDLAKQLKAKVIILSVGDDRLLIAQTIVADDAPMRVIAPIQDYLREAAKGYTGEIKKLCDEMGVESETFVTAGHPVDDIVKVAKKTKADLIVMGSHGRSALAAAVLGSVTYGVVHHKTKIPVLIVRRS